MTAHRVSAGPVRLKRAYEPAAAEDGVRVLVDRLWPRAIRKEDAAIDHWMKEVAPSSALRQWSGHDPDRWPEFRRRCAGRVHVDFPAASPHALGCGGAAITVSEGRIVTESVWNEGTSGTGGGISTVYPPPSYQSGFPLPVNLDTGKPGRGVPDVADDADPASGYRITVDDENIVVGGTSAVAPLWAGFLALANEARGRPFGFINAALYSLAAEGNTEYFREITKGNNKPVGSSLGYDAGPGWNACSGLGVMRGAALFTILTGSAGTAVTDVASK